LRDRSTLIWDEQPALQQSLSTSEPELGNGKGVGEELRCRAQRPYLSLNLIAGRGKGQLAGLEESESEESVCSRESERNECRGQQQQLSV
jgi:hypothetical protein